MTTNFLLFINSGLRYSSLTVFSLMFSGLTSLMAQWNVNGNYTISGAVGIGTLTPSANLEVVGFGQFIRNPSSTSYTTLRLLNNTNNQARALEIDYSGSSYSGSLLSGGPTGEAAAITTTQAYPLLFGTSNTLRLAILANGNVGIGTADPKGYKLAVAGKMIAEEIIVKLYANWPDYVFEEDYKLRPLSEVASYLKKNRHLPEVPTAEEIDKNGANLGEMNLLLLKKIEELTLYLIELKQENESLDCRLKKIEENSK